ncbi:MAG TPA: hypothetical protein VG408_00875 [Actinomycetota bacterium]|nr:hypothetical protein [Actinomycetota bacterium]
MATAAASRGPLTQAASVRRAHVITGLLGLWMTLGTHVDGWAHTHVISPLAEPGLPSDESFLTPWHGILYSGWLALAAWIYLHRDLPGYRLGLIGAIGFGVGGVFDFAWHTVFGIEVDMEALLSPPHLLLVTMHLLMISTPLRAAWNSEMPRRIGWREFTPAAMSLTACVALVVFITPYGFPFNDYLPSARFSEGTFAPETRFRLAQEGGMLTFFVATLILLTPMLAILKRWRPPFGTATVVIGLSAVGSMVVDPLLLGAPILALSGIAMGLLADLLIAEFDPGPHRRKAWLAFGALTPLPLVVLSFVAIELEWGLGWGVNLVTGSMVIASLVGFGLALAVSAPEGREVTA